MVKVTLDTVHNCLVLILDGRVDSAEFHATLDRARAQLAQARPGFVVIQDVSRFDPGHPEDLNALHAFHDRCDVVGAGRFISVVDVTKGPPTRLDVPRRPPGKSHDIVYVADLSRAYHFLFHRGIAA